MGLPLSMVFESREILIPKMCCYSLELSLRRRGAADRSGESAALS